MKSKIKRKIIVYISIVLIMLSFNFHPFSYLIQTHTIEYVQAKTKSTTVYTTESGTKYHKSSCKTIKKSKSKTKTTVKEAKADGYSACKVCKP